MEKKKKELLLIIVLIPVMGFLVYKNLISPKKKVPPATAAAPTPDLLAPGAAKTAAKEKKKEAVELPPLDDKLVQLQENVAALPWSRDPFNPQPTPVETVTEASAVQKWRVSGIIPGPAGGAAIINGEVIGVGESYRGYKLDKVDFDRSQIILEKEGQSYIITIPEEKIR